MDGFILRILNRCFEIREIFSCSSQSSVISFSRSSRMTRTVGLMKQKPKKITRARIYQKSEERTGIEEDKVALMLGHMKFHCFNFNTPKLFRVAMPTVTKRVCSSIEEDTDQLRRGPWTFEEDTLLIHYIACHGEGRWNLLAKCSDAIRCFWMPRLLQKMEVSSPPSTILSQNSSNPQLLLNQPSGESSPSPPLQGSLTISEPAYAYSSNYYYEKNSNSENCTSPSASSDSMNISQLPEISEYPTSPPRALGNTVTNPSLKGCYYMESSSSDMKEFNLASMSEPWGFKIPIHGCHVVESNWMDDDMADSMWNMDELW
ncbi:hypothetical protein HHK36_006936 [Tetracentron sinense]|uniref:Uncharacterized protein n=1 Tax=Tetracentron sinense TaxID=13715 RepID=A0A834ZLT3_TETSI|nr:hypothetical protein HHK36_006936 [Tetracentron sinense]